MLATTNPFPFYPDLGGDPLDDGEVFFGVVNQNPEIAPIQVYWDAAGTQPADQPLSVLNGYLVRSGTPALVYAGSDYSMTVRDKKGRLIYYAPNSADFGNSSSVLATLTAFITSLASSAGAALVGWIQTGTSAVARLVQDKLRERISAFDFMTAAQVADVQAGTLLIDVTTPLQNWANAITGKKGYLPTGSYKQTAAISFKAGTTVEGDGIAASRLCTALDIEQINADAAGAYNVTLGDFGLYNTFPVASVAGATPTGTTTSGQPTISAVSSTAGLVKGMGITGAGIPAGTLIRKITTAPNVIYLCDAVGVAVNATASAAGVSLTTQLRQGQTHFHIHALNAGHWLIRNVYTKSAFNDTDYNSNNHAGIWLERTSGASYFINVVEDCWIDHGQLLMATGDSHVKNNIIWSNPFDYSLKLAAEECTVVGNSISAGQVHGGIWITKIAGEINGASNHNITGNNIDGGDIFYSGMGIFADQPLACSFVGNRINGCYQQGIIIGDSVSCSITGNEFFNCNRDGLGYGDIEVYSTTLQTSNLIAVGNAHFQSSAGSPTPSVGIKEFNLGFFPQGCVYGLNTFTANYQVPAIVVVTPASSGQYPKIMGNAGSGTDTESVGNTVTNQFALTLTGCTTTPSANVSWSRQGNLITLTVPTMTATSNTTACTLTGVPAAIRPVAQQTVAVMVQNSGTNIVGIAALDSTGVVTLFTSAAGGAFTNTGTKGVNTFQLTYQLVS